MDFSALLIAAIPTVGVIVTGYLVARRWQQLGGGEAQEKLNKTYKELNDAFEAKIAGLIASLDERNKAFLECKAELDATMQATRRERLLFQQDADDLRTEIRSLRQRANASDIRADKSDERADASDKRQATSDTRQDISDKRIRKDEAKAEAHAESPPLTPDVHPES